MSIQVISFYRFQTFDPDRVQELTVEIAKLRGDFNIRGLFILGAEGVNCTFSIAPDQADQAKAKFRNWFGDVTFKDSFCAKHPFDDLKVKVRDEIVTAHRPHLRPTNQPHRHISPTEWQQKMNDPDVVVIDTRNRYEYDIGHFQGALNPDTREFGSFPQWLSKSGLPKDKKILIYCTGGIRCEKAILEMEEQGYRDVYQLDGGILNYLSERQKQNFTNNFEGECFVFDYRVAVDDKLAPTQTYKLCPHCGQPAQEKIDCIQCGSNAIVCATCLDESDRHTCSKNCAHHFRMGHRSRRQPTAKTGNSGHVSVDSK